MICTRGEQVTPVGQSGIYFICRYGANKGNHCRWARWCPEARCYRSVTDKNGNVCPDFSIEEFVETSEVESEAEPIKEPIEEIVAQPLEKELEKNIEEPFLKMVVESEENIGEPADAGVEEIVENPVDEDVDEMVNEIADEIFNNFIKQSESNGENKLKIKFIVGDETNENIKQPIIKTLDKNHDIFNKTPIIKTIRKN